jgi:arylsulfatase A-like enzyme
MPRTNSQDSLPSHLLAWTAVPAAEWALGHGQPLEPLAWQWALEVAAFASLAVLQWRFARDPWLRTLLWPALLVGLSGLAVTAPSAPFSWQFFYLAGLVLLSTSVLRDLTAKVRVPLAVAVVLSLLAPVGARLVDLDAMKSRVAADFGGVESTFRDLLVEKNRTPEQRTSPAPSGPPIVVISVDTLRADSAAGMRSWKRLAERGAVWPVTVSSSSWTLPAVASLQTGLAVADHGADCLEETGCQGLYPAVPTLATELAGAGYRTAAVTANPWISHATGLSRGFQTFEDLAGVPPFRLTLAGRRAGLPPQDPVVVVDRALDFLSRQDAASPFFLWVHLLGPHMPYAHSPDPQMQSVTGESLRTGPITSPAFRAAVRAAYDAEVEYNDREVERLLDALEAKQFLDRAVVVLTSDHGEEFWEHGGIEHGHSMHREVSEIPLVIAGPGFAPAEVRPGIASLTDVAPTLRAIAGLEARGFDLRQALPSGRAAESFGTLYGGTMRSARDETERVIASRRGLDGERWERYDLSTDPGEQNVLPVVPASRVHQTAREIRSPRPGVAASVNRDALQALGYAH